MPRYQRFVYANSQTAALWDDATRIVTTYDESGVVVSTRPYTADDTDSHTHPYGGAPSHPTSR